MTVVTIPIFPTGIVKNAGETGPVTITPEQVDGRTVLTVGDFAVTVTAKWLERPKQEEEPAPLGEIVVFDDGMVGLMWDEPGVMPPLTVDKREIQLGKEPWQRYESQAVTYSDQLITTVVETTDGQLVGFWGGQAYDMDTSRMGAQARVFSNLEDLTIGRTFNLRRSGTVRQIKSVMVQLDVTSSQNTDIANPFTRLQEQARNYNRIATAWVEASYVRGKSSGQCRRGWNGNVVKWDQFEKPDALYGWTVVDGVAVSTRNN